MRMEQRQGDRGPGSGDRGSPSGRDPLRSAMAVVGDAIRSHTDIEPSAFDASQGPGGPSPSLIAAAANAVDDATANFQVLPP